MTFNSVNPSSQNLQTVFIISFISKNSKKLIKYWSTLVLVSYLHALWKVLHTHTHRGCTRYLRTKTGKYSNVAHVKFLHFYFCSNKGETRSYLKKEYTLLWWLRKKKIKIGSTLVKLQNMIIFAYQSWLITAFLTPIKERYFG